MITEQDYIRQLGLQPHPEGGYYRQLYGNDNTGTKDISTIYYMLTAKDISAFHCLHGVVEIWYYHAGRALNIYVIDADGILHTHKLSPQGEMQVIIYPGQWFAAEIPSHEEFSLVGCAVAPAFTFDNFELGHRCNLVKAYPQHAALIERLSVE